MPILDLYDDPSAAVLRGHLSRSQGRLNEKLAEYHPAMETLAEVPDRLFALVGTHGGEKLRKYAMHDPENLALSILYFLECGAQLPDPVRAKVASNLITGCGWYETMPPFELTKVALIGAVVNTGLTLTGAPGVVRKTREKNIANQNALISAQQGDKLAHAVHVSEGNEAEAQDALDRFIRGDERHDFEACYDECDSGYPNPFTDSKQSVKSADTQGTELGSFGGLSNDPRSKTPQKRFATAPKVAAPLPYFKANKTIAGMVGHENALGKAIAGKQGLQDRLRAAAKKMHASAEKHVTRGEISEGGHQPFSIRDTAGYAKKKNYATRLENVNRRVGDRVQAMEGAQKVTHTATPGQVGQIEQTYRKHFGPRSSFAQQPTKVSAWNGVGEIEFLVHHEPPVATHFALPHRGLYPIDTAQEVKTASAYFTEYGRDFDMDDRRIYAQSVVGRAEELDVRVSTTLQKLASNTYGPHIVAELKGRIAALEGTDKEAAYEVLLENIDETPPIVMYGMLKTADEETGIDNGYGRPVTGFKEPLSAVFGAPERPIYSWAGKGSYVTEEILRSYAKLVPDLDKVIEKDWSQKFCDDPVKEFDKLPDAKKIIVSRLANGEAFRWI